MKFWITSPMLPCQIRANATFKSPSNQTNQLTRIPLISPGYVFRDNALAKQPVRISQNLLPFLSRTPHQYSKHYKFNSTAPPTLYPQKQKHIFAMEQIPGVRGC